MSRQKIILAGFVLTGLAVVVIASDAKAQSNKVLICQQECDDDPVCIEECGSASIEKRKRTAGRPPPPKRAPPPTFSSWQDEVFNRGKAGGGAGGGGGGGGGGR
jgi:hypothetical protein